MTAVDNLTLRNLPVTHVIAEGAGLFPLAALVQADGFFASVQDSVAARNTTDTVRRIGVLVPEPEAFARRLRAEGWHAEWAETYNLPR